MSKNLQSPTKLTEFAPLQQEEKPQTVSQFISKFFKINNKTEDPPNAETTVQDPVPTWAKEPGSSPGPSDTLPSIYPVDLSEGRSLPNVLKRISNLLALKTNNLQDYATTELKQYWMPDSVSKECYECSEKFTTFRRRHHCRVCGQIFCSQCCNQQIPGKIFGCTGDLRVCTYCCKVVLSYLQSSNFGANLSSDLRVLQENLQIKFGDMASSTLAYDTLPNVSMNVVDTSDIARRKISVGYQEETFASESSGPYLSNEEKCKALQNSVSLRNLYEEICKPTTGIKSAPFKYRLRTYQDCFSGSELVDWLICQQKAKTRIQAAALAQALLEGSYIESFVETTTFVDGYVHYRKGNSFSSNFTHTNTNVHISGQEEPSWVQQIPHDSSNTDSDNEQTPSSLVSMPVSTSYCLNLNLKANTVYLSRPEESPSEENLKCDHTDTATVVRPSEQRELAPESGWFNASHLRQENGEKEAYDLLTEAFEQHELSLLEQLLLAKGVSSSWSDVLIPLTREIVAAIRPDKNHDAIELDIRNYVQIKKLPGGSKTDTHLVNGIVCSKNVAHKEMATDIENPRILLLQCPIMYQRTEGRLMSLEPVLMQEQEYLRHVSARIAALQPDVVLVHKNISRLAQDMLRQHKITLVHNVKRTILERLARCTDADIVTAVDAHIGRPKLGTCKRFYLKSFSTEKGGSKTLMFFEGLVCPHLGSTVLLRGASKSELIKVKQVASFLVFAAYNWRLEKSFLMDEFALPPNSRMEFLDESRENSPQSPKPPPIEKTVSEMGKRSVEKPFSDPLQSSEPRKIKVEDNSDPLQCDDGGSKSAVVTETLTVSQLPFSNTFKKYLDDTILCVSPYIILPIPYLETDAGNKCKLRPFFFKDMYYSEQFESGTKNKRKNVENEVIIEENNNRGNQKAVELHPFLIAKITNTEAPNVQNMLAHFRACGSRYPKKALLTIPKDQDTVPVATPGKTRMDVLDPMNHQRLAVLFYSFSHESNNAPAFCVNPWVVYMDFYGRNDIPIGCFLERYCFRSTYACPSKTCLTPMVKHVRRFVHNSGSITVSLNNFQNEFDEENIVMWTWCTKCQSVSPTVPLSADSWSYSFAKYLELRFHGEIFNRRGLNPCRHSLHHDHYHYFGYKNYVASFVYSPINIVEISLPSPVIETIIDVDARHKLLIEEAKTLALKGHDIFALIHDKLTVNMSDDAESALQTLTKDQLNFKQKVEEIQLRLTSPSVEYKEFEQRVQCQSYWKIYDQVTRIKTTLAEVVENWNVNLRKSDKKKDKTASTDLESPAGEAIVDLSQEIEKSEIVVEDSRRDVAANVEESVENKREMIKKEKSVKNILDKLLASSGQLNLIQSPFAAEEHYTLPSGVYGPFPVFENELSSIIAYALNSHEYKKALEDMRSRKTSSNVHPTPEQHPSPLPKRKTNGDKNDDKTSSLLGFLRNKETDVTETGEQTTPNPDTLKEHSEQKKSSCKNSHIEVQFQDTACNFFCRIYLADEFASLREAVLPSGEETFVRSLSHCVNWKAVGGKSGSSFIKTLDDRFVLKGMPRNEVQMFLDSAEHYFGYMQKCHSTMQPTLLGKIVGIYMIIFKNSSNVAHRSYHLVIENLFYNRNVSQKFDLKGSMRNRFVVPDKQQGEIVLLDENLLKMTCDNPLYVLPHSKEVLLAAIRNDTEFLFTQSVMDYSLLVGLDTKNKELVLGIIDYIRTFTWDKRLETMVKTTAHILGGQGKLPTIISPEEYQKRFIEAMHRYFLEVPDHYAGLGKGLEVY